VSATASATDSVRALVRRSIEVIAEGQASTGAYVASPTFAQYRYCWFRDGSFIADAMSRVGEVESAERFFDWCSRVLLAREHEIRADIHPHARYTADGDESPFDWPTFQLDGLGLWIWAARVHAARHTVDRERWRPAAELTADYLARNWRRPCTDWWEEREGIHLTTLSCVWAGLAAWGRPEAEDVLAAIAATDDVRLDASLLVLHTPLGVRHVDTACFERLLSPGGGVHRHLEDTYYGGGEWVLLTALLGWVRARAGDRAGARAALKWVAAHATEDGLLPEQSQDHLLAPDCFQPWVEKWGQPACPLLWSHAMFLSLAHELGDADG
jgi:GH15 family glucan-1,4-alpha-glucosidase